MSSKARLFAEMGFEGLFFARIDYNDKVYSIYDDDDENDDDYNDDDNTG